jgi:hypothetical protein
VRHGEIREVGRAGEYIEGELAILNSTLQIIHHQSGIGEVVHVELCLCSGHLQAQMKPDVFGNVDGPGEAGSIVDLPVRSSVKDRSVLHGVGKTGFVLAEIDPLAVSSVGFVEAKLNSEKAALSGSCDVHINDGVAHSEIFQNRGAAIE